MAYNDAAMECTMALAVGATGAAIHLARAMVARGLLSPDEVEQFAHAFSLPFDEYAGDPAHERVRATFEHRLHPMLASLRKLAQDTWQGDQGGAPPSDAP